jgi:RNA polymerase sigma factor (sigma-70 family)
MTYQSTNKPFRTIDKQDHTQSDRVGWPRKRLPMLCQELFLKYCVDYTEEAFEKFYYSTVPVFLSFAMEKCQAAGNLVEPQDVVNRLYGILVTHASGRHRVPIKALFSWCFGVICNLIKEEQRFRARNHFSLNDFDDNCVGKNPLDLLISKEELDERSALYEKIMQLISNPNPILTDRERYVLDLFYCKGQPLRNIAVKLKITVSHTAVILYRSRQRIAVSFRSGIKKA